MLTAIKKSHCTCLIDKINARVSNWVGKHLSYAGRVQLINSLLRILHMYCVVFSLFLKLLSRKLIGDAEDGLGLWKGTKE